MTTEATTTGRLIREARVAAGMSQRDVANRLDVYNTTVSRWELGLAHPTPGLIFPLAELLDLNPQDLVR